MRQIIIVGLLIICINLVEAQKVNFNCGLKQCKQELNECFMNQECKQQYDNMNQCYTKSQTECFSKSFFGERLISEECMHECLNKSKIQTLEGSNFITCQIEQCLITPTWDIFGISQGQQNAAYIFAWVSFFVIISTLAAIVWFMLRD